MYLVVLFAIASGLNGLPVKENYNDIHRYGRDSVVGGAKHQPIPPGTDKGLYNKEFFEGDILLRKETGRNAIADPSSRWPGGVIIYRVDESVGCPDSPQCDILSKAMNHYHVKSCIRFKEWTGEKDYVNIFFNNDNSGACWSPVGRMGGQQDLSLGYRCWYFGIVVHELGHAVGFWHEMNRPDRDSWITVYWQNIISGFESAFAVHSPSTVNTLGEQFDYKSIMMYDEYAFSKDGVSPTIVSRTSESIGPIWKKRGLSASDIRRIEKLYQCQASTPGYYFPYDVKCDFNNHTCGFRNGAAASWQWRTVNATEGYVYTSYESSGTDPGQFLSANLHPSDVQGRSGSPLGCIRFWYLLHGDARASLKLSQIYLDRVTQMAVNPDTTYDLWMNGTVSGDWQYAEVPFHITRPFKLLFQSQFQSGATHGTIALDDVDILYMDCSNDNNKPAMRQPPALGTLSAPASNKTPDVSRENSSNSIKTIEKSKIISSEEASEKVTPDRKVLHEKESSYTL